MMRISTNTIYQNGINRLGSLQVGQSKLQEQISTGKRITTPADDPIAAARILDISNSKNINNGFASVRKSAVTSLETIEANLSSVSSLLTSVQSTLVSAGNGTYSNQERGFLATELQGSLDALVNLANTKNANGDYLYAGFQTDTQPFVSTAAGATYQGDSNQQKLQVDTQRQMEVSVSGDEVFLGNGNDVFGALKDMINLLNTPITDATTQATYSAGLATATGKMQVAANNVLNVRASVGSKLNELDSLDAAGADRILQYDKSLSDLQDLDYASALTDLSKNQTILEAAQKSFVTITQLSLFDFMR
jgi:flagellar hook-associated protein 3 FlgL